MHVNQAFLLNKQFPQLPWELIFMAMTKALRLCTRTLLVKRSWCRGIRWVGNVEVAEQLKGSGCTSRGSRFGSQNLGGGSSQSFVCQAHGDLVYFPGLYKHRLQPVHRNTYRQNTHTRENN